jgi:serine protease Do
MRLGILSMVCLAALSLAAPSAFPQTGRPRTYAVQSGSTSFLGIGVREVTADRARALNLQQVRGAEVAHVDDNGPAAKAGLKEGDVVLDYNGTAVEGVEQFVRLVRETPAGRQVRLVIWRNGSSQTLTATLGERQGTILQTPGGTVQIPNLPDMPHMTVPPMPPMPPIEVPSPRWNMQSMMLGIEGESLGQEKQLAEYFGVTDGVLVRQVVKNTPAEKAGLKAGDVITKVDGANVSSTRDITNQMRAARNNRAATLTVVRDKREMVLTVNLENQQGNPAPQGEKF